MTSPEDFFLPHIDAMEGYVPGEQPRQRQVVKLNTNENPYPPSAAVIARLSEACGDDLRRYPDSQSTEVRIKLAALFRIPAEQILVGNGSDELLNVALRCFAGAGSVVAVPSPTYPYYQKLIQLQDARPVVVEFPEDFSLPPDLPVDGASVTIIANPNSPSGTLLPSADIRRLAHDTDGVLIVEALAQVGGVVLLSKPENRGKIAYLMTMEGVKFRQPVHPGDQDRGHRGAGPASRRWDSRRQYQ